jgi:polysaccharide deacetylase family protein (PEP-CTERM system associated)
MTNVLTFDLEDWNELAYRRVTGSCAPPTNCLERQMELLLSLLDRHKVRSTFFVLGLTAEKNYQLIKQVAAAGHEIACHGYSHSIVYQQSPDQFIDDTRRAKDLLEQMTGTAVIGYRAAEFSIRRDSLWALEILAELGFQYDSSIFPVRHRRYGIPGFSPDAASYRLRNGLAITEIPLATLPWAGGHWPIAGGGYLRMLPKGIAKAAIAKLNRTRRPVITYFHPYEFDDQRLRIFASARARNAGTWLRGMAFELHQNFLRSTIPGKLEMLLKSFLFTTCAEFMKGAQLGECRELLSRAS